jgi:hypothetical protein
MIDLKAEVLLENIMELESRYYDLLRTHQELVNAHEELKGSVAAKCSEHWDDGFAEGTT